MLGPGQLHGEATESPSGISPLEWWWLCQTGSQSLGDFPHNSSSQQTEASRVVKAGAGSLFGFSGYNNGAAAIWVHVFDTAQVPANGAVPVTVVSVAGNGEFSADWGLWGRAFQAGCVLAGSSTLASLTLVGAVCWFDAQFI